MCQLCYSFFRNFQAIENYSAHLVQLCVQQWTCQILQSDSTSIAFSDQLFGYRFARFLHGSALVRIRLLEVLLRILCFSAIRIL
jgi:hypothetical protein